MKKVLFATTALVAMTIAGAANAGDVKVSLDGYMRAGVGVGNFNSAEDGLADNSKSFAVIRDGEIHFKGKGVLDNGLEIATRVELEAFTDGDQIDENWVSVKSNLGTLLIGSNDDAAYNVGYVGITSVSIGVSNLDGTYDYSAGYLLTKGGSDQMGVHYYTPKIFGFEFGVSYQPNLNTDGGSDGQSSQDNAETGERVAVGAKYSNTFGDVSFTIGGGYIYTTTKPSTNIVDNDYFVGVSLGYMGFTLDGRWEARDSSTITRDENTFAVGLTYSTGPWSFGVAGAARDFDQAASADVTSIMGGFTYELGNGVALGGAVTYGDVDNNNNVTDNTFGGSILLGINF